MPSFHDPDSFRPGPRLHDAAEFENGMKKVQLRLPSALYRQNFRQNLTLPAEFVSVSKTANFVILPFSNATSIMLTHFAGRILCHFHHEANIFNAPCCPYCHCCVIYLD